MPKMYTNEDLKKFQTPVIPTPTTKSMAPLAIPTPTQEPMVGETPNVPVEGGVLGMIKRQQEKFPGLIGGVGRFPKGTTMYPTNSPLGQMQIKALQDIENRSPFGKQKFSAGTTANLIERTKGGTPIPIPGNMVGSGSSSSGITEAGGTTPTPEWQNPLAGMAGLKGAGFLNELVKVFQSVGGQALQAFNTNQRVAAERNAQLLDPTNPNNPANVKLRQDAAKESNAQKVDSVKAFQSEIAKLLSARNKSLESNTDPNAASSINSQYADTLDELKKGYAATLGEDHPIFKALPDFEKLAIPRGTRKKLSTATAE